MKKINSILLIDDEDIANFINQKVIESLNIAQRIQTFDSGVRAMDYLKLIQDENAYYRMFAPQIILLDINMPVMDGFQFLDEFDKLSIFKQKPIDIFMLSSSPNSDDIDRANKNKNCSGYIIKPLTGDNLLFHLKKLKKNATI